MNIIQLLVYDKYHFYRSVGAIFLIIEFQSKTRVLLSPIAGIVDCTGHRKFSSQKFPLPEETAELMVTHDGVRLNPMISRCGHIVLHPHLNSLCHLKFIISLKCNPNFWAKKLSDASGTIALKFYFCIQLDFHIPPKCFPLIILHTISVSIFQGINKINDK